MTRGFFFGGVRTGHWGGSSQYPAGLLARIGPEPDDESVKVVAKPPSPRIASCKCPGAQVPNATPPTVILIEIKSVYFLMSWVVRISPLVKWIHNYISFNITHLRIDFFMGFSRRCHIASQTFSSHSHSFSP